MTSEYDGLSRSVKPLHYDLTISDIEFADPWTYQGIAVIDIDVASSTKCIVLNSHELTIHAANISSGTNEDDQVSRPASVSYDVKNQRCIFSFEDELAPSRYTLFIEFEGTINHSMIGLYRSSYEVDGQQRWMYSTQFQSSDARRAFPCFDEPGLKATFGLEIVVPLEMTALSNMEPSQEIHLTQVPGMKAITFRKTPKMSTYLLAWAFGDLEYTESILERPGADWLPIRVYTTPGLSQHAEFALQTARQSVEYFTGIFGIDYPLPKLDMIAVHEMADEGMENWGLITFQNTSLLFDPATSDPSYRKQVAYIVAHEIAHQWFGNLVTPEWWNELWLNEGFATWAGWKVLDHFHPEWQVWARFAAHSMQSAFALDSLRTSHAIEVEVPNGLEVDSIFDSISYMKGSSVIRMLAGFIGEEKFLKGVSAYLKQNQYSNTTARMLWHCLTVSSGWDVATFMTAWTRHKGFPVLTITELKDGKMSIQQNRFLLSGDVKENEDETVWHIALRRTHDDALELLTQKSTVIEIDSLDNLILNANSTGFYRIRWPKSFLRTLGSRLHKLSVQERIGIISDVSALATAGSSDINTSDLLSAVQLFRSERDCYVWDAVLSSLEYVQLAFAADAEVTTSLDRLVLGLVSDAAERLGWDANSSDSENDVELRAALLTTAGQAGHKDIIGEVQNRFEEYMQGDTTMIPPSLRQAVFSIAVQYGDAEILEELQEQLEEDETIDGEEIILEAMGQVSNVALATKCLDFAFSDEIESQNIPDLVESLANNKHYAVRCEVWNYIKSHWELVIERLGGSMAVFGPFIEDVLETATGWDVKKDVGQFFAGKDTTGYSRAVEIAIENIDINTRYMERDIEVVRTWLRDHKYIDRSSDPRLIDGLPRQALERAQK